MHSPRSLQKCKARVDMSLRQKELDNSSKVSAAKTDRRTSVLKAA